MDKQHEDVQIRASLETLAHQVSENLHLQLRSLRAALDRQLASVEAALDEAGHAATVDAAVKHLSHASAERADHARKQAEAAAAQALSAIESELRARLTSEIANSTALRAALDAAKKDVDSAQNRAVRAEAAQRAAEAQHGETISEHKTLTTSLEGAQAQVAELQTKWKNAQREVETKSSTLAAVERQVHELSIERADLMERIKSITAAKAAAEAQCQQLESVSQKLSGALSQMLREREPGRAATLAATPVISPLKEFAKPAPVKVAPVVKSAPPPPPSPPAPVELTTAAKKPLQFSEKARDAKRVKVRRGIDVNVDGIPGELVDLSIGGAQAILRQAVKPNQLIRLVVPTATGQLICKGRIVWVVYEQPGTSLSVYRTGVKFTDVDETAIETFMNDYSEKAPMQRQHSSDVA
jgi:PilZ domain-containing protein